MQPEKIEWDLQRLKEEQQLILNQIDNAIALIDPSQQLILFNQPFTQLWGLPGDWLTQKPLFQDVCDRIVAHGYWSNLQSEQIQSTLHKTTAKTVSFSIEQANGIHLDIKVTVTATGGHLLTFRDVTVKEQARREAVLMQTSLNAEIRRLRFLQGLTERLQPASELREIGEFALAYLVETTGAAFGDVKVIIGQGRDVLANTLTHRVSSEFIASYGTPVVSEMEAVLQQGIPYGQGLLWQVVESGAPLFVEDYSNHP
ncbi:MAG TPA: PAS-domain containing protein, partial [Stenomitos sp.]